MNEADRFARFAHTGLVSQTLKQKTVYGAIFSAAGGALDFGLRLLSTVVLARLLIPEQFGLIAMVTAVTGIAEQFSSLGLSTATIQSRELTHQQCSNLFWINVATGALFAVVICALAPALSAFYQDGRLAPITLALSANFIWGGLRVQHDALLCRQMKQPQVAANSLSATCLSTILAVALAFGGQGYWALVWRELARSFLAALGVWILCPWLPSLPSRGTGIGNLLRFGRDLTLTQVLVAIISRLDTILIGKFAGPVALGLYRQAYNLMMAPIEQLNAPIWAVSQPGLSMLQTDPGRYRRYYHRILLVVSLATMPLGVFTAVYAKEIVLVVLGPNWKGAAIILMIFGVAAAIRPAVATSALVLVTCGRSGRFLVTAMVHSVTLIILMVVGIPWGAVGIAIAHVSATVVLLPWKLHYSFAGTPVSVRGFFSTVSRPLIASIVMMPALLVLQRVLPPDNELLSLLAGCAAAFTAYLACLALLPGGWKELHSLFREVMSTLRRDDSKVEGTIATP